MRKTLLLLIIFQSIIGCSQSNKYCKKILSKKIEFHYAKKGDLDSLKSDFSKLKNCGVEQIDIDFFTTGSTLVTLLIPLISEFDGNITYQNLLDKITEVKKSPEYDENIELFKFSKDLPERKVDIENWETIKISFNKLKVPSNVIEKIHLLVQQNSNLNITYAELFKNLEDKNSNQNKEELINKLFNRLNNWDKNELKCYEQPFNCPDYVTSGETNGLVSSIKKELKQLDRIAIWNIKKMKYELFLLNEYLEIAIIQLEKDILKDNGEILNKKYYHRLKIKNKNSDNGYVGCFFKSDYTNLLLDSSYKVSRIVGSDVYIDTQSIIKGHINNDNKIDFVLEYSWHHKGGNMFGNQWYIFMSTDKGWISIPNSFGDWVFGKESETITSITNGTINTQFISENNTMSKKYQVKENKLVEIK